MLIYSYVQIPKWAFSDETEGIRSRSLALKKSCSTPQPSILFNTASITKTRILVPKKKFICYSLRKRILYPGMIHSQNPQPLPLHPSFLCRDEGLSLLIPDVALGPSALDGLQPPLLGEVGWWLTPEPPDPREVLWVSVLGRFRGLGLSHQPALGESPSGRGGWWHVRVWPARVHSQRNLLQSAHIIEEETCNKTFF